jgi:hypothetical protein
MMARPSLTDIAREVGVSKMTVSRALRGGLHVEARVRDRILRTAEAIGYRPDPEITKLMRHFRQTRTKAEPPVLALVWADQEPDGRERSIWSQQLRRGAVERAAALGYRLDEFSLSAGGMTPRRLSQILEARGIPGLLLTPLLSRSRGHVSLDWSRFASVAIGLGYARPELHRVHHHHYLGMMSAMRRLKKLGYRRIALFGPSTVNERMFGAWSASFLTHHPLPLKQAAELLWLKKAPRREDLHLLLGQAKPDVILDAGHHFDWVTGLDIPREIGYATLNWTPEFPERAGTDQQAEVLGAAAMDMLAGQLQHNERGVPAHPRVVMTTGEWRDGKTLRKVC